MERRLRILHFEDSIQDAELIRENLAAGGIQCDITLVQNKAGFVKAFDDHWDLILSDFNVPGFDGIAALDLVRKKDPHIPFILISGTIGEELAIESMKNGSTDYILKDRLARLVPAIQRALQEAEERQLREESQAALIESEKKYRLLVTSMQEGLLEVDNDDVIQFVNDRLCLMFGYHRNELLGQVAYRLLVAEEDQAVILEKNRQRLEGISERYEMRRRHKDGHYIWMEISASPAVDARGAVIGSVATFSDVTGRKRVEDALLKHEQQLSSIYDTVADIIFHLEVEKDGRYRFISVNQAFVSTTGLDYAQLVGKLVNEIIPEPSLTIVLEKYKEAIREKRIVRWEEISEYPTGRLTGVVSVAPVFNNAGSCTHLVGSVHDVTERKRVEEEIYRRDRMLNALVEVADRFLSAPRLDDELELALNKIGKAAEVSRAYVFQNHLGADGSLLTSQRSEWTADGIAPQIENESLRNFDYSKNGIDRWVEVLGGKGVISGSVKDFPQSEREILAAQGIKGILVVPIFTSQGWYGFMGFDDCVGERAWSGSERSVLETAADLIGAAIDRQRSSQEIERQAKILDATTDAVIVEDIQGEVIYHNPAATALYGWNTEDFRSLDVRQRVVAQADSFDRIKQEVFKKGHWSGESEQKIKSGKSIVVESRIVLVKDEEGHPAYFLIVNRDITEKKLLQEQFLRAQRLEGIGTLAGGIAHDLNNVLSPILLSLEVMRRKIVDPGLQRMIDTIESCARRGADLIKQVLSFARGIQGEYVTVQIGHLVHEIESIMKEIFPKFITFVTKVPKNLWPVSGDATQLHQILMNLCVNARDAMPDGGRLEIRGENVELDEQYVGMHIEAKVGRYVCLGVTDTGIGIPPEIKAKIFDPFYTTKEIGKGTGLGLSTVLTIVKSHGGFINVYSEPGKGATFRVYLPVRAADVPEQPQEREETLTGNGELILVVDDEEAVREITRTTLEAFGYNVVTANDGTDAISKYVLDKDRIALVVTDMMMPYMDGAATIRALKKMNPKVRILAVSGLAQNGHVTEGGTGVAFLHKPYTAQKLLQSVRTILDSK